MFADVIARSRCIFAKKISKNQFHEKIGVKFQLFRKRK